MDVVTSPLPPAIANRSCLQLTCVVLFVWSFYCYFISFAHALVSHPFIQFHSTTDNQLHVHLKLFCGRLNAVRWRKVGSATNTRPIGKLPLWICNRFVEATQIHEDRGISGTCTVHCIYLRLNYMLTPSHQWLCVCVLRRNRWISQLHYHLSLIRAFILELARIGFGGEIHLFGAFANPHCLPVLDTPPYWEVVSRPPHTKDRRLVLVRSPRILLTDRLIP